MRNILIAGVLVGLASTAPAVAADTPAASAAQAPTAEGTAKPEKRICKRDNAVGTRLARATCLTKSQWKARERKADDDKTDLLDRINRSPNERPMPPGKPTGGG